MKSKPILDEWHRSSRCLLRPCDHRSLVDDAGLLPEAGFFFACMRSKLGGTTMIKARQFIELLGLVGLAVLLLFSGITPATAQPVAPGRLNMAAEHGPSMG